MATETCIECALTAENDFDYRVDSVTTDGRTLVISRVRTDLPSDPDLLLYDIENAQFEVIADEAGVAEHLGRLSPSGRYVVYARSRKEQAEPPRLQIRDLETRATYSVAPHSAEWARWSADGTELFYVREGVNRSDSIMRVSVVLGDRLEIGIPEEMFTADLSQGGNPDFFVTADGERFLYSVLPGTLVVNIQQEVRVVVNWLDQLSSQVPSR